MQREVFASGGRRVAMRSYAPGEHHARHRDRHSRISLVLRGGYQEEARVGSQKMGPGDILLKARSVLHEDQFGAEGALLVALEFHDDDPFDIAPNQSWARRSDAAALRHALSFIEAARAGDAAAVEMAGLDLLASNASSERRSAPAWLLRLKAELEHTSLAQAEVGAQARAAGAHPAHASRLFRRCFGVSITEHAQTHAVRRALGALAGSEALSAVALGAGFYDQSHMNRVFKRVTGRAPGAFRALLAGG